MKAKETTINTGGVLRCCLQSIPMQILEEGGAENVEVQIGDRRTCEYCGTEFELMDAAGLRPYIHDGAPAPKWLQRPTSSELLP